jgi:hypothetical protein
VQVFSLQAVKRRESLQNSKVDWSLVHLKFFCALGFQPHDFACESYHTRRSL